MSDKLKLKSIREILDKSFYIPAYQRGYRWSSRQVIDLLDDIWELALKKKKEEYAFNQFLKKYIKLLILAGF